MPSISPDRTDESKVIVSYPVKEAEKTITLAEHNLIYALSNNRVVAIKFVRDQYKLNLLEAKAIVDTIQYKNRLNMYSN